VGDFDRGRFRSIRGRFRFSTSWAISTFNFVGDFDFQLLVFGPCLHFNDQNLGTKQTLLLLFQFCLFGLCPRSISRSLPMGTDENTRGEKKVVYVHVYAERWEK
jgi:hypothetical protein